MFSYQEVRLTLVGGIAPEVTHMEDKFATSTSEWSPKI